MFFISHNANYINVNLKLTFKAPEGENPSLEEFNEFLTAVSNLHEQVILHTQPEYFGTLPASRQLLDYHKLKIEKLCRKNPFDITLTFQIIQEGLITYWPFIKALIYFCKKYGKNSTDLEKTLEEFRRFFNGLYDKLYRLDYIRSFYPSLKLFNNKDNLFEKMNRNFTRMMTSRAFKVNYDKFCTSAITITDFVSIIEEINGVKEHDFFKD